MSQDRAWRDYTRAFRRDVLPKLLDSAYMLSIADGVPEEMTDDVLKAATELGLMLLLGKPLILIVPRGVVVQEALRRAATEVVEVNATLDDPADQDRIAAAFRRLERST